MKLALGEIQQALGIDRDQVGTAFDGGQVALGYAIDSRTIRPGELFFAVRGERLDGHDFVRQALERGAIAAVVAREKLPALGIKDRILVVDDTLAALQALARFVRQLWAKPLIAVTGSAGKTTTKEAIAHLLATRFRVHKSEGNFNNHFGLPLMLLKLEREHDCAVVELGMSHAGEIRALAAIAQPDTGVVTNVAAVHLEFFPTIADIARAKFELIESLPAGSTAVLNADDPYVSQFGRDFHGRVVTYGFSPTALVRAEDFRSRGEAGSAFELVVGERREPVKLALVGRHNVSNALAAVSLALEHGIALEDAALALASLRAGDRRGQVLRVGNIQVINDCYNSNPKALAAMVDVVAAMPARRRIVIAGEMLELGRQACELHRKAGEEIAQKGVDLLLGVQGLAAEMVGSARRAGVAAEFVATAEEAGQWLAGHAREGDVVLLKASRGVKLEKALEIWKTKAGGQSGSETHGS